MSAPVLTLALRLRSRSIVLAAAGLVAVLLLVGALDWLKYLSPFYYYAGNDPLAEGVDLGHLLVLAVVSAVLTAVAVVTIDRRDLRA